MPPVGLGGVVVVVIGVVEASVPKVYPRVTLASSSTLSGSVVRTLRSGEGLPKIFCLVASSHGHLRSQCSIVCGSSLQWGHRGSAERSRRLAYPCLVAHAWTANDYNRKIPTNYSWCAIEVMLHALLSSQRKRLAQFVFKQQSILFGRIVHLRWGMFPTPLTGSKEESKELMELV